MPLITGSSVPHPDRCVEGEEIVRAAWKQAEYANPLVPGSNPGGPTKSVFQDVQLGPVNPLQAALYLVIST